MAASKALASPTYMVWELFQALRRHCVRMRQGQLGESEMRQDAAIAVILAVQCVEVFLNVFFRVLVSEATFSHAEERICADLKNTGFGLDQKLKEWPLAVFGQRLELGSGVGQRFQVLKNTRHRLMHFTSTHETLTIPRGRNSRPRPHERIRRTLTSDRVRRAPHGRRPSVRGVHFARHSSRELDSRNALVDGATSGMSANMAIDADVLSAGCRLPTVRRSFLRYRVP